jgi:hypothetical protein
MPTTIFDWIVKTAMLVMAGLVTLSILGAIATMTGDPGMPFAGGDRPVIEGERPDPREAAEASQAPEAAGAGNGVSAGPAEGRSGTVVAARPAPEDKVDRWLEAIAYALLALAGIGALGVLMLLSILRELRRIGRSP